MVSVKLRAPAPRLARSVYVTPSVERSTLNPVSLEELSVQASATRSNAADWTVMPLGAAGIVGAIVALPTRYEATSAAVLFSERADSAALVGLDS